jgi:flagellar hook-length control protein FliK
MTTVSAIMNPTAPAAPAPTAPGSSDKGASFEAALTQALGPTAPHFAAGRSMSAHRGGSTMQVAAVPHQQGSNGASPTTTAATSSTNGPTAARASSETGPVDCSDGKSATDSAQVDIPSGALAAFVAAYVTMASQMVPAKSQSADDAGDTEQAATIDAVSASSDVAALAAMFATRQEGGTSELGTAGAALAQLLGQARDGQSGDQFSQLMSDLLGQVEPSGQQADPNEALMKLLAGNATDGATPTKAISDELASFLAALKDAGSTDARADTDSATISADQLAQAIAQLGGVIRQQAASNPSKTVEGTQPTIDLAASAAQIATAMAAASTPINGTPRTDGAASADRLSEVIASAKAVATVAEAGQQLNLTGVSGSSQVTVRLNPESLGTVQLDVRRTADGVSLHVTASTAAARQAVEANLDSIKSALGAAGIAIDDVRVSGPTGQPTGTDFASMLAANGAPTTSQSAESTPSANGAALAQGAGSETTVIGNRASASAQETTSDDDAAATIGGLAAAQGTAPTATTNVDAPAALATPPAARADAIQLVRDIADQVGLLSGQGKSEFQLQLNPESLGRLHVRMTLEDGAVTVRMTAQSAEARSAIESHLGQLRQSFQDQGIRVDRFQIVAAQAQLDQHNQNPRRSRGLADQTRSTRRGESEADFAQALAAVGGARSLDYRA